MHCILLWLLQFKLVLISGFVTACFTCISSLLALDVIAPKVLHDSASFVRLSRYANTLAIIKIIVNILIVILL